MTATATRHDWTLQEARELFNLPFNDLLFRAQSIHREHFDPNEVQVSTLLSIKTGACPEDCKYCPQSGHYNTGLEKEKLLEIEKVVAEARVAREKGASRFCMGAAWRSPSKKDMPYVLDMVRQVKSLGLETCMTLGMLKEEEARELIREIRENDNPDLVVFVSHGGYGLDQKFAKRVNGIDVYLSGHTHEEVLDPVVWNNTIIFQGGAHGKYVVSLDVDVKDKIITNFDYRLIKVRQNQVVPDPEVLKLIEDAYRPYQKQLSEVIGETKVMLHRRDYWQSSVGNLLTDAMRSTHKTDIAFFPAWRYGATLMPGKTTLIGAS